MSIVVKIIEGPFPFLLLIWLIHFTYYLSNLSFDPRPQTCEYGSKCPKAHSMEELQEWMMRAAEEKEIKHNIQAQGLMSYNDMLLEEYKNSSNEVYIVSIRLESTVNNLHIVLKNFVFDRVCWWINKVCYSLWQHFHHRNFLQLLKAHRLKLSIRVMTFCNCDMLQPLTFLTDKVVVSVQVLEWNNLWYGWNLC